MAPAVEATGAAAATDPDVAAAIAAAAAAAGAAAAADDSRTIRGRFEDDVDDFGNDEDDSRTFWGRFEDDLDNLRTIWTIRGRFWHSRTIRGTTRGTIRRRFGDDSGTVRQPRHKSGTLRARCGDDLRMIRGRIRGRCEDTSRTIRGRSRTIRGQLNTQGPSERVSLSLSLGQFQFSFELT